MTSASGGAACASMVILTLDADGGPCESESCEAGDEFMPCLFMIPGLLDSDCPPMGHGYYGGCSRPAAPTPIPSFGYYIYIYIYIYVY